MYVLSYSDAICCALLLCSASHCLTVPCCCLVVGLPCGVMSCRNRAVSRPRRVEIVPFRGHVVWMSVMSSHASHNKLKLLLLLTFYRAPVPNSLDLLTRQSFVIDLQACHPSFVKL